MPEPVVAVIGGNGFIGGRLSALLAAQGCCVIVVSRQGAAPAGIEARAADVSDREALTKAVEGAEVVYSLSTGGGSRWSDYERDVIGGARNVVAAARGAGARRIVYVSSIAALYLGANKTMSDTEPPDPQAARRSYYSRAKALAEAELLRLHREEALPVVIFRPGVVMGAGSAPIHGGLGQWLSDVDCIGWGSGTHPIPFVLVDDVAEALRAACSAPGIDGLAMNLAGDAQITAREFVEEYARRALRPIRFRPRATVQLWGLDIGKWLVKVVARKDENPFPSYRDYASRSLRSRLSCELARKHLNWRPNSSREDFFREVIDANLPPLPPGDLRLPR